jgi:hypothetical protein
MMKFGPGFHLANSLAAAAVFAILQVYLHLLQLALRVLCRLCVAIGVLMITRTAEKKPNITQQSDGSYMGRPCTWHGSASRLRVWTI